MQHRCLSDVGIHSLFAPGYILLERCRVHSLDTLSHQLLDQPMVAETHLEGHTLAEGSLGISPESLYRIELA